MSAKILDDLTRDQSRYKVVNFKTSTAQSLIDINSFVNVYGVRSLLRTSSIKGYQFDGITLKDGVYTVKGRMLWEMTVPQLIEVTFIVK
jgi:hypothetical protein